MLRSLQASLKDDHASNARFALIGTIVHCLDCGIVGNEFLSFCIPPWGSFINLFQNRRLHVTLHRRTKIDIKRQIEFAIMKLDIG